MVWSFFRKKKPFEMPAKLYFKSGASFFEYQCKFGNTSIVPEQGMIALVMDSSEVFGTEHAVTVDADGRQMAVLKVASSDGGFLVVALTISSTGDPLKPDDVVIWLPVSYAKEVVPDDVDDRFGWTGLIVAKVKPEIDLTNQDFEITCEY